MGPILTVLLLVASAQRPWPYPFGPFPNVEEAGVAAKLRHRLEANRGEALAVRDLCASGFDSWSVEDRVAKNFLIERAERTLPPLLDVIGGGSRRAFGAKISSECRYKLEALVRTAICFGYDIGGSGPLLDAHPLAVERRARAQQTVGRAIGGGGRRATAAMDVVLVNSGVCTGLEATIGAVTPGLVKRLGVPRSPLRVPRRETKEDWEGALEALSFGGADAAVAERPVAAFLTDDATAPLAALALARMGADASGAVPHLIRILDGVGLGPGPVGPTFQEELAQLSQTVDALTAIGPSARGALPNVAAFVSRSEMPGCHTLGAARYATLVHAIATPADGALAVAVLAPLLACRGTAAQVVRVLGEQGTPGRPALLSILRDDARSIADRLEAVEALCPSGETTLSAADQKIVTLLEAKQAVNVSCIVTPSP
jgi:hypothetical protein